MVDYLALTYSLSVVFAVGMFIFAIASCAAKLTIQRILSLHVDRYAAPNALNNILSPLVTHYLTRYIIAIIITAYTILHLWMTPCFYNEFGITTIISFFCRWVLASLDGPSMLVLLAHGLLPPLLRMLRMLVCSAWCSTPSPLVCPSL